VNILYGDFTQSIINTRLKNLIDACFLTDCEEICDGVFKVQCENDEYLEINYLLSKAQSCDYFCITRREQGEEEYHYHHEVPLHWSKTNDIDTVSSALTALMNGWKLET